MKAVLCKAYGPPETLVLEEISSPRPERGQVVIAVKVCSLSFPDLLIIEGKYQFRPSMPFSPGGEIAGVVKEVGEDVTHIKVGDRVMAFIGWGGFAEEVAVDADKVVLIPACMDFATASGFIMTYGTSYYALKERACLKPREKLLVLGAAGGVGLTAIELGKLMGAYVIAAASTDEKLEICRHYGADEVINYSTENLKERIKGVTRGEGVDVIYDPVGGDYAELALRGMAWNGRYLVIGFAAGHIPQIPLNLVLLKGAAIVGVFWGAFTTREPERYQTELQELLSWYQAGRLTPLVSAKYPLESAAAALEDLKYRRARGKVLLLVNPS